MGFANLSLCHNVTIIIFVVCLVPAGVFVVAKIENKKYEFNWLSIASFVVTILVCSVFIWAVFNQY